MALRAWYRLNGNTSNYGVGDMDLTQATAPTWSAGILGAQALNEGSFNWTAAQTASVMNNTAFSYAAWIYVTATDSDNMIFGNNSERLFALFQYPTRNDLHWSWKYNDSGTVAAGVREGVLPDNTWTHIAFSYKQGNVKFYINGSQVASESITYSRSNFSVATNVIHNKSGRRLQDVRIYDHALSAKEVRELSRGLAFHIPFYGDGYPGIGENIVSSAWEADTAVSMGQYYTTMLYDNNFWGLAAGDTYTYRIKITAPADRGISARIQFFTDGNTRTSVVGNTIPAGTTGYSVITDTLSSSQRAYTRMELCITTANSSVTSTCTVYVGELKLERGDHATPWSPPASSSAHGSDYGIVKETAGYGTVSVNGSPTAISSGPRYGMSAHFAGENTGNAGDYVEYTAPAGLAKATWMAWINIDDTQGGYPSLDTKKGNPTGDLWLSVNTESNAVWAYYGGIYNSKRTPMFSPGDWHHIAFVWNTGITQWYVDGEVQGASVDMSSKSTTWPSSVHTLGTSYTGSSWSGAKLKSRLCDWRFYSTALTADDIRGIARAPVSFTDNGEVHCGALVERDGQVSVEKSSIVKCSAVSEIYGRFDSQPRIEPDGSAWVRIVHHADPGAGNLFASSDSFGTWVYKDAKRWFHGKMCDYADRWEFMIEQKANSSASTLKFRWVQTVNPNAAAYADVAAASITKNTSTGYTSFSHGGLYKKNSSAYYTTNNGTQSNWWGAVGAWSNTTNGIPAWNGTEVGTGGFEDLYIRVDGGANWSFPDNDRVSIVKTDNSLTGYGITEI